MPEPEIHFRSTSEYQRLRDIRDRNGVTWRGMLLQGAKQLEGHDLRNALVQLDPVLTEQAIRETDRRSDSATLTDEERASEKRHRGNPAVDDNEMDAESASMVDLDGLDLELPREMLVSTVTGGDGSDPGSRRRVSPDWNELGTSREGR